MDLLCYMEMRRILSRSLLYIWCAGCRKAAFVLAERRNFQPLFCSLDFFFGSFFFIKEKERTFLRTRLTIYSSSLQDSWQLLFVFFCSSKRKRTKRKGRPCENGKGLGGPVPSRERRFQYTVVVMRQRRLPKSPLQKSNDPGGMGPGHRFRKGSTWT